MAAQKMYGLNISLADEFRAKLLKAVIDYEASVRGLSRGQTLKQLVVEAAELDSYPDEVREQLDKIAERTRKRAIRKSIEATKHPRVA